MLHTLRIVMNNVLKSTLLHFSATLLKRLRASHTCFGVSIDTTLFMSITKTLGYRHHSIFCVLRGMYR